MTVRELIGVLENENQDLEVVMKAANSPYYVDDISSNVYATEMQAFRGEDRRVLVIEAARQIGSV